MHKNQKKWLVISIVIIIILALGLGLGLGLGLQKQDTSDSFSINPLKECQLYRPSKYVYRLAATDMQTNDINENFNSSTVINGLYINDSNIIGVVIPCTKTHVKHLFNLMKNINNQSLKPHEISVSLSEIEENECNDIRKKCESQLQNINLKLICSKNKQNAAENRNKAINNLSNAVNIVSFFDADDEMCIDRIKRINFLLEKYKADMCIHNHILVDNENNIKNDNKVYAKKSKVRDPETMKKIEKKDNKNIHISAVPTTHGHATVRRNVLEQVRFDENSVGREDSKFVRNVFSKNFRVVHTEEILSYYYEGRQVPRGQ